MVLGTVTVIAAFPVAVAVGTGAAATAAGGGVAVATAGATATATATAGVGTALANGFAAAAAPLTAAGPIGWVALGCTQDRSWDCWKPVVHDTSLEPSTGRLLKEIIADERIKETRINEDGQLFLLNIWDELFRIDYVTVDDKLASHATRC